MSRVAVHARREGDMRSGQLAKKTGIRTDTVRYSVAPGNLGCRFAQARSGYSLAD
jgi:hypothetical protein